MHVVHSSYSGGSRILKGGFRCPERFRLRSCMRTRSATHARKTTKRGVPRNPRNPPGFATVLKEAEGLSPYRPLPPRPARRSPTAPPPAARVSQSPPAAVGRPQSGRLLRLPVPAAESRSPPPCWEKRQGGGGGKMNSWRMSLRKSN